MPTPSGVASPGRNPGPKVALVAAQAAAERVRFGPFELDVATGELWREGESVRLQQQPARVLCLLVQHAGELVTREELRRHLWGDEVFVDFQRGLNFCVMQIRTALEDDAETPRYVATLPRRGYRFVAPLQAPGSAAQSPSPKLSPAGSPSRPGWRRNLRILGVAAAVVAGAGGWTAPGHVGAGRGDAAQLTIPVRVAVLPFRQMSAGERLPVAEGLTEEVIAETGRLAPGRLGVIARSSVERYATQSVDLARVSRELDVDFVLEGSVRSDGGRARVTARLVRAADQSQLWVETYERSLDDVLGLQREIARAAASGIGITLGAAASGPPALRIPDAEAWRHCLLGRRAFEQRTDRGVDEARRHFEAAIAAAPDYAPAHAGLADTLTILVDQGRIAPRPGLAQAEAEATRALELDPALDAAHVALGGVTWLAGRDLPAARRHLERALALNPTNSLARKWYCGVLANLGQRAESLEQARNAALADPLSVASVYTYGERLLGSGRKQEALGVAMQLLEIDGQAMLGHLLHGLVLGSLGRTNESLAAFERAHRIDPGALEPLQQIAVLQHQARRASEARATYAALVGVLRAKPYARTYVAAVAVKLGLNEDAIRLLGEALQNHEPMLQYIARVPCYEPLRGDPRFADIERRVGEQMGFLDPA